MRRVPFALSALLVVVLGCDGSGDGSITGRDDGGGGGGTDGGAATMDGIPCDVAEVLADNCLGCHGDPPVTGAPMPLTTWAQIQAPAVSDESVRVYEMMSVRINSETAPMPPPSAGTLSEADRATLNEWLGASAPAASAGDSCTGADGGVGTDGGGIFGGVGPEHLPCEPSHTFTAHAPGSDAPFEVPADAGNLYECFAFRSPFTSGQQATAWAPIVDDTRVVHHWILYRTETPQEEGSVSRCSMPSDAEFLMGWAPGGENAVMPDHVGLELPEGDQWLILQLHYWNVAGISDADDASGVAVCTTDTPRENEAAILWLGSTGINIPPRATDHTVTGTCPSSVTSLFSTPMHILGQGPHMHELGTHFITEVLRDGDPSRAETLVEVAPWDFNAQSFYWHEEEIVVQPGDSLRTRCTYDNPTDSTVRFGERTEDEMCFDFVMVYPTSVFIADQRKCLF